MTDNSLIILLPYPDVLERLKAAWEKTRVKLAPPCPRLHCTPGEFAARLELYATRFDALFPDIAVVLEIAAQDQSTILEIKRADAVLLRNWLETFKADLPTDKQYLLMFTDWLEADERARPGVYGPRSATYCKTAMVYKVMEAWKLSKTSACGRMPIKLTTFNRIAKYEDEIKLELAWLGEENFDRFLAEFSVSERSSINNLYDRFMASLK